MILDEQETAVNVASCPYFQRGGTGGGLTDGAARHGPAYPPPPASIPHRRGARRRAHRVGWAIATTASPSTAESTTAIGHGSTATTCSTFTTSTASSPRARLLSFAMPPKLRRLHSGFQP